MKFMLEESYWDVKQLCAQLCISKDKVYALCATKELPYFRVGHALRFSPEEIKHWLEENRNK